MCHLGGVEIFMSQQRLCRKNKIKDVEDRIRKQNSLYECLLSSRADRFKNPHGIQGGEGSTTLIMSC